MAVLRKGVKWMKLSFKQIITIMLTFSTVFLGCVEYVAIKEANVNSQSIKSSEERLNKIDKELNQLNVKTDKVRIEKDKLIKELYPVQVAKSHGYDKEVASLMQFSRYKELLSVPSSESLILINILCVS